MSYLGKFMGSSHGMWWGSIGTEVRRAIRAGYALYVRTKEFVVTVVTKGSDVVSREK